MHTRNAVAHLPLLALLVGCGSTSPGAAPTLPYSDAAPSGSASDALPEPSAPVPQGAASSMPSASPTVRAATLPPNDDLPMPELAVLPAVSKSGRLVAAYSLVADHACGVPTVFLIDVRADALTTIELFDGECGTPAPERVKAVHNALAAETWTTLTQLTMEAGRATDTRTTSVWFVEPTLTFDYIGQLNPRTFPDWSDKPKKPCATCAVCPPATATLGRAWTDQTARIALIEIVYMGGDDQCWAPEPAFHAVTF